MRLHSRSRIVTVSIFKLVTGNQRLTWRNEGTTGARVETRVLSLRMHASVREKATGKPRRVDLSVGSFARSRFYRFFFFFLLFWSKAAFKIGS